MDFPIQTFALLYIVNTLLIRRLAAVEGRISSHLFVIMIMSFIQCTLFTCKVVFHRVGTKVKTHSIGLALALGHVLGNLTF